MSDMPQSCRRSIWWIAVAVVIGLTFLAWSTIEILLGAVEHERVIEATHVMAEVIAASIASTGHWPRSVADLNAVRPITIGGSAWPKDKAEILRRVVIDYDVTLTDVAAMTKDDFRALRPADPEQESVATKNAIDRLWPAVQNAITAPP